jgi:hypothetical protein
MKTPFTHIANRAVLFVSDNSNLSKAILSWVTANTITLLAKNNFMAS